MSLVSQLGVLRYFPREFVTELSLPLLQMNTWSDLFAFTIVVCTVNSQSVLCILAYVWCGSTDVLNAMVSQCVHRLALLGDGAHHLGPVAT